MKRKSIGTSYSMCVQPAFIIGTYNRDGSPNFAPITWVSAIDETIAVGGTFDVDLTKFDPVIYSGQYHSLGKHLGGIGDFLEHKGE